MPVTFPAIRPGSRRLTPGTVPQSVTRTINGRTVRRPFASHQGGMRLEVEFPNRPDSEVDAIRQVRNAAKADPVLLPDELFAGDPELLVFVKFLPPDTAWRFSGDVEVEWAKRGRATARVAFVNYRRTVFTLPPPPEVEVPPLPPLDFGFWISESETAGVQMSSSSGRSTPQSFYASDGSIYWCGIINLLPGQLNVNVRYFVAKYRADGVQVWSRILDGPYIQTTGPTYPFSEPCICEGIAGGVFLATRGWQFTGGGIGTSAFVRLYSFTADGTLALVKAYQFSGTGANNTTTLADRPQNMLYVASQNKLYVVTGRGLVLSFDALTLGSPVVTSKNGNDHPARIAWLPEKQRLLVIYGWPTYQLGTGVLGVREYSPDLATDYQSWVFTGTNTYKGFGVDKYGAVYAATTTGASPLTINLTKLAASDGGYDRVWTKQWTTSGAAELGLSVDFLPDDRIVVGLKADNYIAYFVLSPDGITVERLTKLTAIQPQTTTYSAQGPRLNPVTQKVVFAGGNLFLGSTSLQLPSASTTLAVSAGVSSTLTVVGQSVTTPVLTTDVTGSVVLTRAGWTNNTLNLAPILLVAEPGEWIASDMAATISMVPRQTGPLVVP